MVLISRPPSQRYHTKSHERNFNHLLNVLQTHTVQTGFYSQDRNLPCHQLSIGLTESPGQGDLPSLSAGPRSNTSLFGSKRLAAYWDPQGSVLPSGPDMILGCTKTVGASVDLLLACRLVCTEVKFIISFTGLLVLIDRISRGDLHTSLGETRTRTSAKQIPVQNDRADSIYKTTIVESIVKRFSTPLAVGVLQPSEIW